MKRAAWAAVAATVALVLGAGDVAAAVTPDEVSKKLSQQFGVQVLRVLPTTIDGRQAFVATVMNPAGNSNEAFRIDHLAVDAETGALLPGFRHGNSGYVLPGEPPMDAGRNVNVPADGHTWR
ncbi:MAG: hypothetical protein IT563_12150 [Alphaproteobacteria bacterium]|nr:hypothetical protein [Alphaproteobacteria bacterium]